MQKPGSLLRGLPDRQRQELAGGRRGAGWARRAPARPATRPAAPVPARRRSPRADRVRPCAACRTPSGREHQKRAVRQHAGQRDRAAAAARSGCRSSSSSGTAASSRSPTRSASGGAPARCPPVPSARPGRARATARRSRPSTRRSADVSVTATSTRLEWPARSTGAHAVHGCDRRLARAALAARRRPRCARQRVAPPAADLLGRERGRLLQERAAERVERGVDRRAIGQRAVVGRPRRRRPPRRRSSVANAEPDDGLVGLRRRRSGTARAAWRGRRRAAARRWRRDRACRCGRFALAEHPPQPRDDVVRGRPDRLVDDEQAVHQRPILELQDGRIAGLQDDGSMAAWR